MPKLHDVLISLGSQEKPKSAISELSGILSNMVNKNVTITMGQEDSLRNQFILVTIPCEAKFEGGGGGRTLHLLSLALPIATWLNTCHE